MKDTVAADVVVAWYDDREAWVNAEARVIGRPDGPNGTQHMGEPLAEYIDRRLDEMEARLLNAIRGMP